MTQQELLDRIAGLVPCLFIVRALKTAQLPADLSAPLDECDFPGYARARAVVSRPVTGYYLLQASLSGTAEFNVANRDASYTMAGIAIAATDSEGVEHVFCVSPFSQPATVSYGIVPVTFSLSAQGHVGP